MFVLTRSSTFALDENATPLTRSRTLQKFNTLVSLSWTNRYNPRLSSISSWNWRNTWQDTASDQPMKSRQRWDVVPSKRRSYIVTNSRHDFALWENTVQYQCLFVSMKWLFQLRIRSHYFSACLHTEIRWCNVLLVFVQVLVFSLLSAWSY